MTRSVKIKICGLRIPGDVAAVNKALPDMTGFIFDPTRKRYVQPEDAERLRQALDSSIEPIGVFVNAAPEEIASVLAVCKVRTVQLHGQETYEEILAVRAANPGIRIIKAYKIDDDPVPAQKELEKALRSPADEILLDHGIGGTGEHFDWSLLQDFGQKRPFLLAGGISAGNVREAIALARPAAVDASSSVETDGHKDPAKVLDLVRMVRSLS